MPEKQYKLWKQLHDDRLYLKTYNEFLQQFSDPAKAERLYAMMYADRYVTQPFPDFKKKFFDPETEQPTQKYQGTRMYAKAGKDSLKTNIELEKKFGTKYGDKNLWTRYAYINQDESLKDMIVSNENQVDPYVLAGTLSGEGIVDELHKRAQVDPYTSVSNIKTIMTGTGWFGLDDFAGRYGEFKKKGLTTLDENTDFVSYGNYTQETGTITQPANFLNPRAGINATSTYLKNIQNVIEESGIKGTPEEKELLIHVGYNYGENGLRSYLKKSKTAKDIINRLKTEKPQVYKNARKRVIVSKELRESKSFELK